MSARVFWEGTVDRSPARVVVERTDHDGDGVPYVALFVERGQVDAMGSPSWRVATGDARALVLEAAIRDLAMKDGDTPP